MYTIIPNAQLRRVPPGIRRVYVEGAALTAGSTKLLSKVGSYMLLPEGNFGYCCVQIWCDDQAVRREAMLTQALSQIERWKQPTTTQEIEQLLESLSARMQLDALDIAWLQAGASARGSAAALRKLQSLDKTYAATMV